MLLSYIRWDRSHKEFPEFDGFIEQLQCNQTTLQPIEVTCSLDVPLNKLRLFFSGKKITPLVSITLF